VLAAGIASGEGTAADAEQDRGEIDPRCRHRNKFDLD
jgi:hypothetical protein